MKEFEYQPLDTLPDDADVGPQGNRRYTYGSDVFGKTPGWIIVENNTDPIKVWKMPPAVSRMLDDVFKARHEMGRSEVKAEMRELLGLDDN